jgi:hypothetical protein
MIVMARAARTLKMSVKGTDGNGVVRRVWTMSLGMMKK